MVQRVRNESDRVMWRAAAFAAGVLCDPDDLSVKQKFEIVNWVVKRALAGENPLRHIHTILSNRFNSLHIAMFEIHACVHQFVCVYACVCVCGCDVDRVGVLARPWRWFPSLFSHLTLMFACPPPPPPPPPSPRPNTHTHTTARLMSDTPLPQQCVVGTLRCERLLWPHDSVILGGPSGSRE